METETKVKSFKSAVMKVSLCIILYTLAWTVLITIISAIIQAATNDAANSTKYIGIVMLITSILSLLFILPLLGRFLHIPLPSLWKGAKVDAENMKFYIPTAYTFAVVGDYFLALPLALLLQHEGVLSPIKLAPLFEYSEPIAFVFLNFVVTVIFVPLMEEFFTRGLLLSVLVPYGKGFAIVTTSIIFAIGHGNIQQLLGSFLLGLVYAYVTLKTGTIKNSFILHAINNGVVALSGIVNVYAPPVGNIFSMAVYAVLGIIGILVLIKKRSIILEDLHTDKENYIPLSQRTSKFIGNPLMLIYFVFVIINLIFSIRPL